MDIDPTTFLNDGFRAIALLQQKSVKRQDRFGEGNWVLLRGVVPRPNKAVIEKIREVP